MAAPKLWVRKQGNVCTVFTDENGTPQPIASFQDAPGIPRTFHRASLEGMYPGREYIFVEEQFPEPPEAPREAVPATLEELAAALGEAPPPPSALPAAPKSAPAASPAAQPAALGAAEERLLETFRVWATDVHAGHYEQGLLEEIGGFLITALPELEERLKQAAKAPATTRRRLRLGDGQ